MNEIIIVADFVSLVFRIGALVLFIHYRRNFRNNELKVFLLGLIALCLFHAISNFFEWTGISAFFDPFEDLFGTIEPLFWFFIVYAFLKSYNQKTLEEGKQKAELLLDIITHDIGNFNQVSIGYLQLIEKMKCELKENSIWGNLRGNLQNISELIGNAKLIEQLSTQKFNIESIQLDDVISDASSKINISHAGMLSLTINPPLGRIFVCGNPLLIHVFLNIFSNSIKYKKSNDIHAKVELSYKIEPNYVLLSIEDHGIGIQDNFKIEAFNRLNSMEEDKKGKGLGLSVSKRIINLIGDEIWAENRQDALRNYTAGLRILIKLKLENKENYESK